MSSRAPVYILNQNSKREQGKNAQAANIKAARVSIKLWSIMFCILGCLRHRENYSRTQVHAQDAPRPYGRHRPYQRRQCHPQRGKPSSNFTFPLSINVSRLKIEEKIKKRIEQYSLMICIDWCSSPSRQEYDRASQSSGWGSRRRNHLSHHLGWRVPLSSWRLHWEGNPPNSPCWRLLQGPWGDR